MALHIPQDLGKIQSFSGWLSCMTTNYHKYVECITVILQELAAHTGTELFGLVVPVCAKNFCRIAVIQDNDSVI